MSNIIPTQANSDQQLIALWLHGKAIATQKAYSQEVRNFLGWLNHPIATCTLAELQTYLDSRSHLAAATRKRTANALKSLFSFAQKVGYLQFNVGAPLKAPPIKDTLAERILTEEQTRKILELEPDPVRQAMLRLLYGGALRISEACALTWRDLQPRGSTGQATVFGKGGKTGVVLLPQWAWEELMAIAPSPPAPDAFIFPGRNGKPITRQTGWRWVTAAATRAGIKAAPHHFRHSHASHALEKGANLALIQQTLRHTTLAVTSRYLHVRPSESSGGFLSL